VHDRHANTGAGELSFTCLGNADRGEKLRWHLPGNVLSCLVLVKN